MIRPTEQVGPVTRAIAAMRNDNEVKRSKRIIPPQSIGAGFVVIRRASKTGALRSIGKRPYEHPDLGTAEEEARRLAERFGDSFDVFERRLSIRAPERPLESVAEPAASTVPLTALEPEQIERTAVSAP
ncbi:hypothetical protein [Methylobacterium iners]|uniref:Uncharacterized protein n=1 Tax=Methylobacterium iners TaxID=418707 RepID=A0ABQ4RSK5_9HYPH|nr:hypothetical protein [Methylobacterium iners]GJD92957.1 hypothetical protein OCOJLMKI_0141 [Methylobacterium iners]